MDVVNLGKKLREVQSALAEKDLEKAALTDQNRLLLKDIDRVWVRLKDIESVQSQVFGALSSDSVQVRKVDDKRRRDKVLCDGIRRDVRNVEDDTEEVRLECDKLKEEVAAEVGACIHYKQIVEMAHKELQLQLRERDQLRRDLTVAQKQATLRKARVREYAAANAGFLSQLPRRPTERS